MDLGSIVQFLENKTISVTGATGFLAKIFVEKILRTQPNVGKIFLLLRAAHNKSIEQRFYDEIFSKDLFNVVREKWGANFNSFISEKIISVPGDISSADLGVKDSNLKKQLWGETDFVVNMAATTKFDERYDLSLGINTLGAMNVLNFAKKCDKLKLLLHASTAYVCGEKEGVLLEEQFAMGETLVRTSQLDIQEEKKMVEQRLKELQAQGCTEDRIKLTMKEMGLQRSSKYGWPNTYVYTKAMGEMLLGHFKENLSLVIIRPTMITSTYKEPFPGWMEGNRTLDGVIVRYGKGKLNCFHGDPKCILDVIPADMVVNTMVAHANQPSEVIYQVGSSSLKNPLRCSNIQNFGRRYFTKNPWINKDGKAVKVRKMTALRTMASFHTYLALHYRLPLMGLKLVNVAFRQYYQDMCTDLDQKLKLVLRITELYKPYMFFKGVFDDNNTEKLRLAVKESGAEAALFYFDPKIIDWEDYLMNIHIPGLVKYVFK